MEHIIKFAIVGYGNIGRRHAVHIANNPATQLVCICDTNITLRKQIADDIVFYDRFEEMLAHSGIDVLCVCTPNYLHASQTIAGLRSGLHVIVEKPMALSTTECDEMIAASEVTGRTIFAVKQNRYNPPVQEVKQLLERDGLGRIFLVQVNCFWNRGDQYYAESEWRGRKDRDGGCLFTQFSHFIDILYYLNGSVKGINGLLQNYAHRHNTEIEDTGSFVMEGENGSIVNFNFTTCSHEKNMEGSITIFGEKGTIKIGGQYLNTIEYQQVDRYQAPEINITAKANDYGLYQGSMSNHDKMIQNVVDVLLHQMLITTTALEGRAVVSIIERMYTAAKTL